MSGMFDRGLERRDANYEALTPVDFIARAAQVYGQRLAIVHGEVRRNWAQTYKRAQRLAGALAQAGIKRGDTVAVMLPNIPAMVEAHFGVPMLGAVLNTLNTRLDTPSVLFMLGHGEAQALIVDTEYAELAQRARVEFPHLKLISVHDLESAPAELPGAVDYEAFLAGAPARYDWKPPADEWDAIALNYTSGTTGDPKGVVYHYRGAYLNAVCNAVTWTMPHFPVYLWTLPLFHCNGWCFPWTLAMLGGTQVCLRKVEAKAILDAMAEHGVDHYCAAPIVHNLLIAAPPEQRQGIRHKVRGMVAGAAPPAAMIEGMAQMGFELTHTYGLTEVYGPAAVATPRAHWAEQSLSEQARLNGRQGVRYPLQEGMTVLDPDTMAPTPADGQTMGEIMFRGNIVMKGYLKNPKATAKAFEGGWFHTGDLAVMEPDRYVKIKDRSKDIIISGGENISSLEVEDALYRHPAVVSCAVVAKPDDKWGETPVAYVELKAGATVTEAELVAHCKGLLAGYKVPREIRFEDIPKTSTGKIQKFVLRQRKGGANQG